MKRRARLRFLPAGKEAGRVLPGLIAVMTYLAVLSAASGLAVYNVTQGWSTDLAQSMTVQIVHQDRDERERQTEAVLELLRHTPGIVSAESLTDNDLIALLEPWLGSGNVSDDLPIPAMINVTISSEIRFDSRALGARITQIAPNATLDDHQQWMGRLVSLSKALESAAATAVLLIVMATAIIVVFATSARLAAHRETVDIIHLMGAEDLMIAREFRHHFMILGFKGAAIGFLIGLVTLYAISSLASDLGAGFLPRLALTGAQTILMLSMPFLIAVLAMLTAWVTVLRNLAQTI